MHTLSAALTPEALTAQLGTASDADALSMLKASFVTLSFELGAVRLHAAELRAEVIAKQRALESAAAAGVEGLSGSGDFVNARPGGEASLWERYEALPAEERQAFAAKHGDKLEAAAAAFDQRRA